MIQQSSILVTLNICQWSARKFDKKITKEVHETHNASDESGRYNKQLVTKKGSVLEQISKESAAAREYHYTQTLPWGNNGERLLTGQNYFNYVGEMNRRKSAIERLWNDFFHEYPMLKEQARISLNGMFNEADYPSINEIKEKFAFETGFSPVPENDFRLTLNDEEIAKLKSDFETEINSRIQTATADIWRRVKEQLSHMKSRLSDPKAVFRDSLFGNLKELIDLLPNLNVTNDPSISAACDELAKLLADPDAVRNNESLRNEKAEQAADILNKFNSFFN